MKKTNPILWILYYKNINEKGKKLTWNKINNAIYVQTSHRKHTLNDDNDYKKYEIIKKLLFLYKKKFWFFVLIILRPARKTMVLGGFRCLDPNRELPIHFQHSFSSIENEVGSVSIGNARESLN